MAATFENSYKNIPVYAKVGVNLRAGAGTSAKVLHTVAQAQRIGTATGYFVGEWMQVIPDKKCTDGTLTAYVHKNYVATTKPANTQNTPDGAGIQKMYAELYDEPNYLPPVSKPTDNDATNLMYAIIKSDQLLYKRLLVAWEVLERMQKRGHNVTAPKKVYEIILDSYKKRQAELPKLIAFKDISDIYEITPGSVPGFGKIYAWLVFKFNGLSGIGAIAIIPAAIAIAVGIVVGAVLYNKLRPHYDSSRMNLKISENLKKLLEQLPEGERKKIIDDLEAQLDDAYNIGKRDQWWKNMSGTVKWIGLGILALFAVNVASNITGRKNKIEITKG